MLAQPVAVQESPTATRAYSPPNQTRPSATQTHLPPAHHQSATKSVYATPSAVRITSADQRPRLPPHLRSCRRIKAAGRWWRYWSAYSGLVCGNSRPESRSCRLCYCTSSVRSRIYGNAVAAASKDGRSRGKSTRAESAQPCRDVQSSPLPGLRLLRSGSGMPQRRYGSSRSPKERK